MASYPGAQKARSVRSSTIVKPNASNAAGKVVSTGAITSKAQTTHGISRINVPDLNQPHRMLRIINQLQSDLASSTQAVRSNPLSAPCIVRSITIKHGATAQIPHTLKRDYSEWHPSNVQTTAPLGLSIVAPTPQYPASQFLVIKNVGTADVTANFVIAGD